MHLGFQINNSNPGGFLTRRAARALPGRQLASFKEYPSDRFYLDIGCPSPRNCSARCMAGTGCVTVRCFCTALRSHSRAVALRLADRARVYECFGSDSSRAASFPLSLPTLLELKCESRMLSSGQKPEQEEVKRWEGTVYLIFGSKNN